MAEAVVRDGMVWRPLAVVFGLTLALTMLGRRTRPFAMVGLGFGAFLAVDLASVFAGGKPFNLYAGAAVLFLVYSLFRWGTSRQTVVGSVIVLVEWLVSTMSDFTGVTDAGGGLVALLFPAALGVSIRYRCIVRAQQLDQVRFHERDMLARELHDTVAHHVSAIAVQAQAGQFLAKSRDLGGAAEALEVIEEEASRTLAEMRSIVVTLRRGTSTPQMVAQRGLADIGHLATAEGARGLRIEVEYRGDLDDLQPSVQAALYRVAQESITNAGRHARHATLVRVIVAGDTESARLSVSDDGERGPSNTAPPGYGLVGMTERVMLLGGTLEAGPCRDQGWTVRATIPRRGRAR
ncbi:MAG: sensor histidine kinase [Nocardioidaceae bacterium]